MKTIRNQRPKAFIGAAISLGTSIIGGIIGGAKQRKLMRQQQREQERMQKMQTAQQEANVLNQQAADQANAYDDIRNQLMKVGGSKGFPHKGVTPVISSGGIAVPLEKNTFLLKGHKHSSGGIVIGKGKQAIEAEGDEVVQITPKQLKVFSAQPILNGQSPASLVQRGVDKNRVFNAQESFKDRNGLNDDGTKKAEYGKKKDTPTDAITVQRPVIPQAIERKVAPYDRVEAPVGTRYRDLSPMDKARMKNSDRMREDYKGIEIVSPEFDILTGIRSLANLPKGFLKGKGKIKIEPNKYYRQTSRVDKGIERAKEIGVIDIKNPTIKETINPKTGRPKIQLTQKEKFDVPFFSRDNLWYGRNKKYYVIVGNEKDFDWMPLTKHGGLRPDVQSDLSTHIRATPLVNGKPNVADASKFEYYRHYPLIGMRNVTEGFPTIPVTGLNTLSNIIKAKKSSKRNNDMDRLKNGGLRKRYPALTGEYYGKAEGRAIRSLREARGDSRYNIQTGGTPSLSTARMYGELKPANERLFKGEAPKKKTFNQAFAEARRQGLKVFEWNGKKYGTQLASEVKPKTVKTTSVQKSEPKKEQKVQRATETSTAPVRRQTSSTTLPNPTQNMIPRSTSAESFPRRRATSTTAAPTTSVQSTATSRRSNELPEVSVQASRIPYMMRENQFVPGTNYLNPGQPLPPQNIEQANNVYRDEFGNITYVDTGSALRDVASAIGRRIAYPKRALGGLSRKEDYGSKSKPYPNVKPSDFAGGHRSYPIPTKADARDALRLAGLHGRSDVRAKVYRKYPELKKGALGLKAVGKFLKKNDEAVSAVAGGMGSIVSGLMNRGSINNLQAPPRPQLVAPARMKTTVNVNPQLSDSRQTELDLNRSIAGNTASSVASLARQQRVSGSSLANRNAIRANKENIETQLYNQDAMNRQAVAAQNTQTTNAYNTARNQFENERIQALANNRTSMIDSVIGAYRDYQTGVDTRRSERMRLASEMAKNPEQVDLFLKNVDKYQKSLQGMSRLFRCGGRIKK